MSYPLNNTFDTAPPTGYLTTIGGMTYTYDSVAQAVNMVASSANSILAIGETANNNFWFSADIELISDTALHKAVGICMLTTSGASGYCFMHYDTYWKVYQWGDAFSASSILYTIPEGSIPLPESIAPAPSYTVGTRAIFKFESLSASVDQYGIPRGQLFRVSINDNIIAIFNGWQYPGSVYPGIYLYGCTANLHSIAGDVPSGLTGLIPDSISQRYCNIDRMQSPQSNLWDQYYKATYYSVSPLRKDVYFGGNGTIIGTVSASGTPNVPLSREVLLYSETNRTWVASTWSDATGAYRFDNLDINQKYTVIAYDYQHTYRAVIADNLVPQVGI